MKRSWMLVWVTACALCTPDFTAHSRVVNGASDLLVAVFAERGRHARDSIGVNSLPGGVPVEIELIAEVMD